MEHCPFCGASTITHGDTWECRQCGKTGNRFVTSAAAQESAAKAVPAPPRTRWHRNRIIIAVLLLVALICGISFGMQNRYDRAVSLASEGSYDAAYSIFYALGSYQDAKDLSVYCWYASLYSDNDVSYKGGEEQLKEISLQYTPQLQKKVDALIGKVTSFKKIEELHKQSEAERAAMEKMLAEQEAQRQQEAQEEPPQSAAPAPKRSLPGVASPGTNSDHNYESDACYDPSGAEDTGAGSGHSFREDYSDPEDLYEDGDYEDFDEADDEWGEGW